MFQGRMAVLLNAAETAVDNGAKAAQQDPFIVMLVGMAVVFIGLVIIIGIVKLVSVIYRSLFVGREEGEMPKANTGSAPAVNTGRATVELTEAQRGETVVAIAAAVAESLGKPVSGIRIKSIKKIG
ncbi:MAG: OadG family protein [Clostridia bacterium]|nr:OadG family protein [Clostridia bacterium]